MHVFRVKNTLNTAGLGIRTSINVLTVIIARIFEHTHTRTHKNVIKIFFLRQVLLPLSLECWG